MRIPDWLVYTVVLIVIVATLFSQSGDETAGSLAPYEIATPSPDALDPDAETPGPPLPEADPFDERVLVQVGDAEDGIGTAFAINRSGMWLTARHVVDGCSRVGLSVGDGRMVHVDEVRTSHSSD